ncbi:hypothetical protein RGQ29_013177, partial [Quercus rubra]
QTHSKKISPEPPQPQPNHDLTTTTTQPRPTTHFSRRSTTNDPLHPNSPIHNQRPTSSQLADPRTQPNHADPQPTTTPKTTTTTDPCRHPRPKHRTHNPTTNHDQRPKHRTQQRRKREKRWCLV